jgi:chromosome segregation ATPase
LSADAWSAIASLVVGLGGGGALIGYVKDRKKSSAEGEVASATVELQIDAKRLENTEARLAFTQRAWDAERLSFESRINRLEAELSSERLESEKKDAKILELERTVSEIQATLLDVSRELAALRTTP